MLYAAARIRYCGGDGVFPRICSQQMLEGNAVEPGRVDPYDKGTHMYQSKLGSDKCSFDDSNHPTQLEFTSRV